MKATDSNGNVLGDGTRTYEWDAINQLVALNQGVNRSEFTYDGWGKRVRMLENVSGSTTGDRRFHCMGAYALCCATRSQRALSYGRTRVRGRIRPTEFY